MKTGLLKLTTTTFLAVVISNLTVKSQTVSTFENLKLSPNSYWAGSPQAMDTVFISGNAIFPNFYDTSYGGYWTSGWAYSDMQDSVTRGYTNIYSARPAIGYANSANYAVGTQGSVIELSGNAKGKIVGGVYVTNGTYAALSMKYGDQFAKKFGDTTGTGCHCGQGTYPDWFKLTVRNWHEGALTNDSVEFYLADFRFGADTTKDYIVKTWQYVDLTSLGNTDSLQFNLSSSDTGPYGMNTPAYFCIDNFTTSDVATSVLALNGPNPAISIYPNPATANVTIDLAGLSDKNVYVTITEITGKTICAEKINSVNKLSIDMSNYSSGVYFVTITGENTFLNKKIVKE
jgi:hypothetical protein